MPELLVGLDMDVVHVRGILTWVPQGASPVAVQVDLFAVGDLDVVDLDECWNPVHLAWRMERSSVGDARLEAPAFERRTARGAALGPEYVGQRRDDRAAVHVRVPGRTCLRALDKPRQDER